MKSHFERMHESDNFKSERFLQDMCYIQDQVAQGDRFRWYSYITSIKYTLTFRVYLELNRAPPGKGRWKWQVKKIFFPLLLSSFHAELNAAWKVIPQSVHTRISWVEFWDGGAWDKWLQQSEQAVKHRSLWELFSEVKVPNPGLHSAFAPWLCFPSRFTHLSKQSLPHLL